MKDNNETVREILKRLPLQKRLQATENIRRQRGMGYLNDIPFGKFNGFFTFDYTRQGHRYWWKIKNSIE